MRGETRRNERRARGVNSESSTAVREAARGDAVRGDRQYSESCEKGKGEPRQLLTGIG